ncbi:unnamed protein product [Protopolystoma xenopodis]|uniref:Uncharacterized protein n=1 Tax=Protopolystoma xenopodis TaxID=117903 RepID=A0A3S5BDJ8_9PLAT|nr:unnamed protein product [Protopolystoma xenopodis]
MCSLKDLVFWGKMGSLFPCLGPNLGTPLGQFLSLDVSVCINICAPKADGPVKNIYNAVFYVNSLRSIRLTLKDTSSRPRLSDVNQTQ